MLRMQHSLSYFSFQEIRNNDLALKDTWSWRLTPSNSQALRNVVSWGLVTYSAGHRNPSASTEHCVSRKCWISMTLPPYGLQAAESTQSRGYAFALASGLGAILRCFKRPCFVQVSLQYMLAIAYMFHPGFTCSWPVWLRFWSLHVLGKGSRLSLSYFVWLWKLFSAASTHLRSFWLYWSLTFSAIWTSGVPFGLYIHIQTPESLV